MSTNDNDTKINDNDTTIVGTEEQNLIDKDALEKKILTQPELTVNEEPNIEVDVVGDDLKASISQSGKKFEKCKDIKDSKISLEYDDYGGITSITFTPPSICVKDIPTDLTAATEGGYRKVKRSTRKNKKRRSKRKY
jgi:hypothetical protein